MDEAVITTIYIVVTAMIGIAAGTLFERRWWLTVAATPLAGLVHGLLFLVAPGMESGPASPWSLAAVVRSLTDPLLLATGLVAAATGSAVTAAMLSQSRKSTAGEFWLPDMEPAAKPPAAHGRRGADRLQSRIDHLPAARTRTPVEAGYEAAQPPVFERPRPAPPAPTHAVKPAAPAAAVDNARAAPRRRTLLPGRLCTELGISAPCTIHNLSTGGAQVRLSDSVPLPKQLYLVDVSHELGHKAEVRWRFGSALGLRFVSSFDVNAPSTPEAARAVQQWESVDLA